MTRNDFELIVRTIHALPADTGPERANRQLVAEAFADMLAHLNARFDRDRFLRACYDPRKPE